MAKNTNFSLDDELPEVNVDQVEAFKSGGTDTTVRPIKEASGKTVAKTPKNAKKVKAFQRYTFSLTEDVSEEIDNISYSPRNFRVNRSEVVKAGILLLKDLPKDEMIKQLKKVK